MMCLRATNAIGRQLLCKVEFVTAIDPPGEHTRSGSGMDGAMQRDAILSQI